MTPVSISPAAKSPSTAIGTTARGARRRASNPETKVRTAVQRTRRDQNRPRELTLARMSTTEGHQNPAEGAPGDVGEGPDTPPEESESPPIQEDDFVFSRRPWSRWDSIALAVITLAAGVIRFVRLDLPKTIVFDETYYAKDACWYVNVSQKVCTISAEQTNVHPPLAKWLIAIGIRIFGYDSYGWRVSSAVAGVITVALLYLLARRVLHSTLGATIAAGLLAIDLLHFVQSRVAMLDIFAPMFGVAAVLFAVYDRDRDRATEEGPAPHGLLDRPWRIAAGASAGAAVACKWPGAFYLAIVLVLTVVWEISYRWRDRGGQALARFLREEFATIFIWLVLLPIAVYIFTYAGRLEGSFLVLPWKDGSWFGAFWDRQVYMYDFHKNLDATHGYESPPWSWFLLKRPVSYFITYASNGDYGEVMATGSPFVWWAGLLATLYVGWRWFIGLFKKADGRGWRPEGLIFAGFVLSYGPWLLPFSHREAVFIFYVLPAVPFLCLALGYVATQIGWSWEAKAAIGLFAAASIGFFAFYYPVVADVSIPKKSWDRRIWIFDNCDKPTGKLTTTTVTETTGKKTRIHLSTQESDADIPPIGWCWI
jgi:dolichyl-phosphate-mannose--protein O-mannosyl transferase